MSDLSDTEYSENPSAYMARPTGVMLEYLASGRGFKKDEEMIFRAGQLAMALELKTLMLNLERLPVVSELARQEVASVIATLLQDLELSEVVEEWYVKLAEWRRPTFVAEPELSRGHGDDAGAQPPARPTREPSSARGDRPGEPTQ